MKIVIAPDSFKESLSALQVAEAIEAGLREVFADAEIVKLPVADGGEGTVRDLCGRVYWKGSHWQRMSAMLARTAQ